MTSLIGFPTNSFKKREEETFDDYTCVTNWESFTQAIENVLTRWGLSTDGDPAVQRQLLSTTTPNTDGYLCGLVNFGNREFQLIYYNNAAENSSSAITADLLNICPAPGFSQGPVPLAQFGLNRALLLRPTEGRITGGTRLNLVLSSMEMAVNTLRCPVPILLQYAGQNLFHGIAALPPPPSSASTSTTTTTGADDGEDEDQTKQLYHKAMLVGALNVDFAMGRLSDGIPPMCVHLVGLREMFLDKLGYPWKQTIPAPKVQISARFIYQLPFWPKVEDIRPRASPWFSFSLQAHKSVYPEFLLSAVWPDVPSHAVKKEHVTSVLKPEGATEWFLAIRTRNDYSNELSTLLGCVIDACTESKQNDHFTEEYEKTDLGSGAFSLESEDDRLEVKPKTVSHNQVDDEKSLLDDQLLTNLLFLFPDADSAFSSAASMEVELHNSCFTVIHPICMRFRRSIRHCPEIRSFAEHLGFPSPTSLVHRLAVLLANLVCRSGPHRSVRIMYDEFLADLDGRVQRAIPLPDESCFVGMEQTVAKQLMMDVEQERRRPTLSTSSMASFIPVGRSILERSPLDSWWPTVPSDQVFAEWSEPARMNLFHVFERLHMCIQFAMTGNWSKLTRLVSSPTPRFDDDDEEKHNNDANEDDDDDDALFTDAVEELIDDSCKMNDFSGQKSLWSPTSHRVAEAETADILSWLRSLDFARVLRCLLPSICLESLITLHSMVPYEGRLTSLLSQEYEKLESHIYDLLSRLSRDRSSLDGYTDYEARFTATFTSIFTLIEDTCERVTCMYEILEHCVSNLNLDTVDLDLNFLFRLTMQSVRIEDYLTWSDQLACIHWTPIPVGLGQGKKCFLTEFERLFGQVRQSDIKRGPLDNADILEPFRFASSTPKWFTPGARLTLCNPDVLEFVLRTYLGQPNPLSSRPGPQRLYVQLNQSTVPESMLLAGAFSRDTQFF